MRKSVVPLIAVVVSLAFAESGASALAQESAGASRSAAPSPAEALAQTDSIIGRMDSSRELVRRGLASARAQRDVIKTLCLDDKLNQLDVTLRSARERRQDLDGAVKAANADLSTHDFVIVNTLRERAERLTADANACIGNPEPKESGLSGGSFSAPILPEDPSAYPTGEIVIQPPACASCFK